MKEDTVDRFEIDKSSGQKKGSALEIVKSLRSKGYKAYWAGGCVRDMILGKRLTDFDITTDARPDEIMRVFRKTVPVGEKFGVVLVIRRGVAYEVATFRGEKGYHDRRHPDEVYFTDEKEDVRRRDFTINGLLYDPLSAEIIDHVKGRDDIERKLIRTIGDPFLRLTEDSLRLLRAVRFATNLGFEIEGKTRKAIKEKAADVLNISWERIRDEILKILTGEHPRRGFELLRETGLLEHILPEVEAMAGVEQPPEFHPEGDVLEHTLLMLELLEKPSVELALGVLLHDIGKPDTFSVADRIRFNGHDSLGARMTEDILKRMRLPRKSIKKVSRLVADHLKFMNVQKMRESRLKRFIKDPDFDDHLELHRLDCLASHGDLSSWQFCVEKLKEYEHEVMPPPPLVMGKDLIEMGFAPGPIFRKILLEIQDLQIEGTLRTRVEAVEYIDRQFGNRKYGDTDEKEEKKR